MKIGVIVETLQKSLREGIRLAAELGCEGIQFYGANPEFNLLEKPVTEVRELKQYVNDCGLVFAGICGDMPGHGYSRPAEIPQRVANVCKLVDMGLELGTRIITNHIGVVPEDPKDPEYAIMVEAVGQVARYAASRGSVIAIETGPESAEVLKRLLNDVGSAGLGINMDPANLAMVLNADPAAAVRTLAGHIVHTHAKDGIHYRSCNPREVYEAFAEGGFEALVKRTGQLFEEVPLGKGQVKWDEYLGALRDTGYTGFLTIEREVGLDPAKDIADAVVFLKKQLGR